MSKRIFLFSLLAIAATCTVEEELKALSDVNPILAPLRAFGQETPVLEQISEKTENDLGLNKDRATWFDFVTGSENAAEVLKEQEIYNLDQQNLNEDLSKHLNEMFPEPTEDLRDNQFMVNEGYMTMIPYFLDKMRLTFSSYMISGIFQLAENKSDDSYGIPAKAIQEIGQAFVNRIQSIAQMAHPIPTVYNQWIQKEGKNYPLKEENSEEAQKCVDLINKNTQNALELFEAYTKSPSEENKKGGFLFEKTLTPLRQYDDLRLNLSFYMHQEFQWQLLNVLIANEENAEEVYLHVIFMTKCMAILEKEGLTSVKSKHINSYFSKVYERIFNAEEVRQKRAALIGKIIGHVISEMKENDLVNEALLMARKIILSRVDLPATNTKFIEKYRLNTLLFDEENPLKTSLRLFDELIEYESKTLQDHPHRLMVVLEHIDLVLGIQSNNMLKNMANSRTFFAEVLLSAQDNKQVYNQLYDIVIDMVASSGDTLIDSFGQTLDKAIDAKQEKMNENEELTLSKTYFAMKVQVLNMAKDDAWEMALVAPFANQMTEELEYMQLETSKWVLQSITRGLKNLGIEVYKSTTAADRVNQLIAKAPFTSNKMKVLKNLLI